MCGPWLVIAPPARAPIWLDVRVLDRIEVRREEAAPRGQRDPQYGVFLVCGDLEVGLVIADGREAAEQIVRATESLTREGAIAGRPALPTTELGGPSFAGDTAAPEGYGKLLVLSSLHPDDATTEDPLAGMELGLPRPVMTIGRTDDNDIVIVHRSVSRNHARITRSRDTGRYTIADLHSSNEVRVNGDACASFELCGGDIVDLGHVRMRFEGPGRRTMAPPAARDRTEFLFLGADAVQERDEHIDIGAAAFRTSEVREHALLGANLPLSDGREMQAAMALLVVAAADRDREEERPE